MTYANVERTQTEDVVAGEVEALLQSPAYENATLVGVTVHQNQSRVFQPTERVTVPVARPPGERYPWLRYRVDEVVNQRLDEPVDVDLRVHLVFTEESGPVPAQGGRGAPPLNGTEANTGGTAAAATETGATPTPVNRAGRTSVETTDTTDGERAAEGGDPLLDVPETAG